MLRGAPRDHARGFFAVDSSVIHAAVPHTTPRSSENTGRACEALGRQPMDVREVHVIPQRGMAFPKGTVSKGHLQKECPKVWKTQHHTSSGTGTAEQANSSAVSVR